MRKLLKFIAWTFVVIALLAVAISLSLNQIIPKSFNAAAPAVLGVPATLQSASVTLLTGKATLQQLHIGNPAGYKTDGLFDLASVSVHVDRSSLLSDTIVIRQILVDGLVITYEKGLLNSNLGAFLESLSSGEETPEEKPSSTEEEKPGRKVVIEKVVLTHCRMNFSVTGAAALTGGAAVPIPLPTITLTDLGKEKEGITLVEAIRRVLTAIAGATGTAIAGSAKLLGQGVAAVGNEAWSVGSAGVDAGKAVVGGVGDALKAVNPFGK